MSKFKVLFIYPNIHTSYSFSPAIQILSAVLKEKGYDTDMIHINDKHGIKFERDKILSLIVEKKPDLIGFTTTSFEYPEANTIAGWIKKSRFKSPLVLGGIHATIKPDDLWDSNFDAFCIGEGEDAFVSLIDSMISKKDYFGTKSFWFKHKRKKYKNPILPYTKDIDKLPFNDFDIVDTKKLLKNRNGWLSICFSRGCPYNCSFCINPLLKKINGADNTYLRIRSVGKAIQELEYLAEKYKEHINIFNFDDDLLMIFKEWMGKFCREYRTRIYEKYGIRFSINCRVDMLTNEIAEMLHISGCHELKIGVETANDSLRNVLLKKNISKEQMYSVFDICRRNNIQSIAYLMLGLPGENDNTIRETINLVDRIKPDLMRTTFLHPYYGSEIYRYCEEKGLLKNKKFVDTFLESPIKMMKISDERLLKYKLMFPWYVNLRNANLKEIYQKLIDDTPVNINKILLQDRKQDIKIKIPHFGYFGRNTNYYQYKR